MKWHQGLPDSWDELPELPDDRREEVPSIDIIDRDADELKATRTDGGLVLRIAGSSKAWYHSDSSVDLESVR